MDFSGALLGVLIIMLIVATPTFDDAWAGEGDEGEHHEDYWCNGSFFVDEDAEFKEKARTM